ncbi:MAG: Crp/Fnr family transcriptional regulator [Roseivirga sp.]|nr:Crp/Fnr family transcriptional regulator [Roseivirga sp.]
MAYPKVLANIEKHVSLTENEKNFLLSQFESKEVAKKKYILQAGDNCRYFNFVDKGAFRAYYLSKEGKESTIMFAISDWWITDMHCFINEQPAMLHIQAIEHSSIVRLPKERLDLLFEEIPKFERFFRVIMQNAYTREQLRVLENLSLTAEERYNNFLSKYPQIVAHVTQKQIATYLGITPEFLSAIRAGKGKS